MRAARTAVVISSHSRFALDRVVELQSKRAAAGLRHALYEQGERLNVIERDVDALILALESREALR